MWSDWASIAKSSWRARWFDRLHKLRLDALEELVLYQLLNDRLRVMLVECSAASIAFEEVEDIGVISISTYAVVDGA